MIFLARHNKHFDEAGEQGFALSKILHLRPTLIFSFFLPHMKLESSTEFLLDSDLKEYVYVYVYVYKLSQPIPISKMVLFSVHNGIVLDCSEKVQIKKFEKKA